MYLFELERLKHLEIALASKIKVARRSERGCCTYSRVCQGNNATMPAPVAWLDSRVDGLTFIGWREEEGATTERERAQRKGRERTELFARRNYVSTRAAPRLPPPPTPSLIAQLWQLFGGHKLRLWHFCLRRGKKLSSRHQYFPNCLINIEFPDTLRIKAIICLIAAVL